MRFLDVLPGLKSFLGGFGLVLIGVSGIILSFVDPDSQYAMDPQLALATISAGLYAWGISRKVENLSVTSNKESK
jgi:hypothetical protein